LYFSYDLYVKQKRIQENELVTAIQEGELKAEEKYMPLIEEAKKREEEATQREEEARQQIIDLVKLLKSVNVSVEIIADKTGLSKDEIERL